MDERLEQEIAGIAALQEPVRRALYFFVAGRKGEVSRDEAAEALDISRALAAFHLDRLVGERLLESGYRKRSGGPGAGRPAKVYRRSERELSLSVPPRRYDLAARLFASALERVRPGRRGDEAVDEVAREVGRAVGQEARAAAGARAGRDALRKAAFEVLERHGFEPVREAKGEIRLRNCPFDALVTDHRDLVCGMNLSFMQGVLAGLRDAGVRAELDPRAGMCCVALRAKH